MIKLTKEQHRALKNLYDRSPPQVQPIEHATPSTITYRVFRKRVCPVFGGDGAVIVPWCGMWVGIEPDGYTHT